MHDDVGGRRDEQLAATLDGRAEFSGDVGDTDVARKEDHLTELHHAVVLDPQILLPPLHHVFGDRREILVDRDGLVRVVPEVHQ